MKNTALLSYCRRSTTVDLLTWPLPVCIYPVPGLSHLQCLIFRHMHILYNYNHKFKGCDALCSNFKKHHFRQPDDALWYIISGLLCSGGAHMSQGIKISCSWMFPQLLVSSTARKKFKEKDYGVISVFQHCYWFFRFIKAQITRTCIE